MRICKICGYYGRVVCEKTGEQFIKMIDFINKTNCEFFRDITLSKYSRVCENCRSFDYDKEKCKRNKVKTVESTSNVKCLFFASNKVHMASVRCKDCKFFEAPICNLLKEKRNTQIGCENFISYVD